jgi:hypothetical protein
MGSICNRLLQEGTLYGINIDSPVTRSHVIWGQYGLACYKKARFIGSIWTRLLQEGTFYGVNIDSPVTRRHVLWGQYILVC